MGEKYLTLFHANKIKGEKKVSPSAREMTRGGEGGGQRRENLTCERRADFSPANISKVQQHALL